MKEVQANSVEESELMCQEESVVIKTRANTNKKGGAQCPPDMKEMLSAIGSTIAHRRLLLAWFPKSEEKNLRNVLQSGIRPKSLARSFRARVGQHAPAGRPPHHGWRAAGRSSCVDGWHAWWWLLWNVVVGSACSGRWWQHGPSEEPLTI